MNRTTSGAMASAASGPDEMTTTMITTMTAKAKMLSP